MMPKKTKKQLETCSLCGKEKELSFQGEDIQYPVVCCPEHGPDKNEWEIWMRKYIDYWKTEEYWLKPNSKQSCVIGYFCYKFKEFYGHPYVFSFANPIPYKDKDFIQARRLLTMFNQDAKEIKIYIKWLFAKKIKKNYPITSIGFLATANLVNEYFQAKAQNAKLKRSTNLPETFIAWCQENCTEIFSQREFKTLNDLNGTITYVKTYGFDNVEGKVIQEAINRGLISKEIEYIRLEG